MSAAPRTTGSTGTFGAIRRWLARADLALSCLLAIYLLFLVNVIVFRHPSIRDQSLRLDLTRERIHTLSRATVERLKLVREPILVVIPTFLQADNPEHRAHYEVLSRARRLLDQYTAVQPLIQIAAEVDVFARPERWLQVREEFGLSAGQVNRFIFFAGPAREYRQAVTPTDMATFREGRDPVIGMPEIRSFRAEKAMTDAITRLIERKKRTVYFTQDKEEKSLKAQGKPKQGSGSLAAMARELETQGVEARELTLLDSKGIPADCEALIVAGPQQRFTSAESDVIRRYLEGGGKLLLALGASNTGLEDLLEDWSVKLLPGTVQELRLLPGTRSASYWVSVRSFNPLSPITKVFADSQRFEVRMYSPRALREGGTEKGRKATGLLETGSSAEGESFFLIDGSGSGTDKQPGNFTVAIAVEQLVPERPPPGFQRVDTRLVVLGASNILDDEAFFQLSHRDFIMNAMAWLLGEEEKATVSGEDWERSTLPMNPSIRRYLFWVPVVILPAFFLALGAFVYYLRRT